MKLLGYGSDRFQEPALLEAFEIAKRRRRDETHDVQNDQIEMNIAQIQQEKFSYEIFRTNNAYESWIGDQKFKYHDGLVVELITTGYITYKIVN